MSQSEYNKAKAALQNKAIYDYARVNQISYKCALIKESSILSNYNPYLKELEELEKKCFREKQKYVSMDVNLENKTIVTRKAREHVETHNNKVQVTQFDVHQDKKNVNLVKKKINKKFLKSNQLNKREILKPMPEESITYMDNLNKKEMTTITKKCSNILNEKKDNRVNCKLYELIKDKKAHALLKGNIEKKSSVASDSYTSKKVKILDTSDITRETKNKSNDSIKLCQEGLSSREMSIRKRSLLEIETTQIIGDKKKLKHQCSRKTDNQVTKENPKTNALQTTPGLKNSKSKRKTEVIQNNVQYETIFYEDVIISRESSIYIPYTNRKESTKVKDRLIDIITINDKDVPKPTKNDDAEVHNNYFSFKNQTINLNMTNEYATQEENNFNNILDYNIQNYCDLTVGDQDSVKEKNSKKDKSEKEQKEILSKQDYERESILYNTKQTVISPNKNISEQDSDKFGLNEPKLIENNLASYPVIHYILTKSCLETEPPINGNQMEIKDSSFQRIRKEDLTEKISLETLIKTFLNENDKLNNILRKGSSIGKYPDKINSNENKRYMEKNEFSGQENKLNNSEGKNKNTALPNETEWFNKCYNSSVTNNTLEGEALSASYDEKEVNLTEVFYDDVFQYRPYDPQN